MCFKIGLTLHEKCSRFSLSNHMILSAIWNKRAEANFLQTNKIAQARRASEICGL